MLGLAYYEADRCGGCGKSLAVSTQGDERDWLVTRLVCHSCEMLSIQQAALDPKDHKHGSADVWVVERQT